MLKNLYCALIMLISCSFAQADIQASNAQDINFGTVNALNSTTDYQQNINLCIYTTDATQRDYQVSAEMQGTGNYILSNGMRSLPIELWWNGEANTTGSNQLLPGKLLTVNNNSASTSSSCPQGNVANLQVIIRGHYLYGAQTGNYTGTLTFTVSPI